MPETAAKICIKCGRDCSAVPRLRNDRGEYACKACLGGENRIPVSPLDLSGKHRAPCPRCGSEQAIGVPACPACGHTPPRDPGSPKIPRPKRRARLKPIHCRNCEYDLSGLRDGRCPECGHMNALTGRREWDDETSEEVARNAYLKPLVFLGVGLAVTFLVQLGRGNPLGFVGYLAAFPVILAVAYAMLWVCCVTWLGFTSSNLLMLVQLAGIHGAVGAIAALVSCVPVVGRNGTILLVLCGMAYVYLMSEWMDMESMDARFASGIIYVTILGLMFLAVVKGWI